MHSISHLGVEAVVELETSGLRDSDPLTPALRLKIEYSEQRSLGYGTITTVSDVDYEVRLNSSELFN